MDSRKPKAQRRKPPYRVDASSHEATLARVNANIDQLVAAERTDLFSRDADAEKALHTLLCEGDPVKVLRLPPAGLQRICRLAVIGMHYVQVSALETLQAIKEEASTGSAD